MLSQGLSNTDRMKHVPETPELANRAFKVLGNSGFKMEGDSVCTPWNVHVKGYTILRRPCFWKTPFLSCSSHIGDGGSWRTRFGA